MQPAAIVGASVPQVFYRGQLQKASLPISSSLKQGEYRMYLTGLQPQHMEVYHLTR